MNLMSIIAACAVGSVKIFLSLFYYSVAVAVCKGFVLTHCFNYLIIIMSSFVGGVITFQDGVIKHLTRYQIIKLIVVYLSLPESISTFYSHVIISDSSTWFRSLLITFM